MHAVIFDVAEQRFGLPVPATLAIFHAVEVTPVAGAPAVIEGVVDVRGTLCPVVSLRRRFGLTPAPLDLAHHLIMATCSRRTVLLQVDRVVDVTVIDPQQTEDILDVLPRAGRISGVARLPDGLVLMTDLDGFLTEAESTALDAALLAATPRPVIN
ncbi:MAG TPA: chemotaxis protein CheW [Gemmatimonadales bacterium]|jgi:purine-binding chemotaxis protein CheW|nr:chemotaxis protein CheW [Gemmatimonadales bacterium]